MKSLAAILVCMLLFGCASGTEVSLDDPQLRRQAGVLYFQNQAYSGALVQRNAEGKLLRRQSYQQGRLHGVDYEWHANGQLSSERHYWQGRKVGRHQGWWPDASPRFDYQFQDGEFHGVVRSWFADGQLAEERHYSSGHETGSQRSWFADGRVRANYWYRDGRRYGSIGVKLCASESLRLALHGARL